MCKTEARVYGLYMFYVKLSCNMSPHTLNKAMFQTQIYQQ